MLKRIITGIVAIGLLIPICIFSDYIVFPIAISIISMIGVFELAKCLNKHKNFLITIPMYLIAGALPIIRFFISSHVRFFAIGFAAAFALLVYILAYIMLRRNKDSISEYMTLYGIYLYVVVCFSCIVCARYMNLGKYIYLLIFIGAWVCDTFAYFTGRFFGKHKLIPEISPKKTVEGAIGGIVFTVGAFELYVFIIRKITEGKVFSTNAYFIMIGLAIVVAIVSQIGDLIASSIKRQYDIKDYGFIFPGHGGVLDRFDSAMLVAPLIFAFFYVTALIK